MGLKTILAAAAALLLALPSAAAAQQAQALEVKAGEPFRHAHTKLELPASVAGLARTRVVELEADQLDVLVDYGSLQQGEEYTFYIYRNVSGALPVWFDRAQWMIEHRAALGSAGPAQTAAFAPPGRSETAALAATYAVTGTAVRSTGIALLPLGEFYVKLRVSSTKRSPDELLAAMKGALAELRWPKPLAPAPSAVPVTACTNALSFSGEAKPVPSGTKGGANAVMDAILGGALVAGVRDKSQPPARPVPWCRDPYQAGVEAVYRADGQTDGYLLALGDAGRAISVEPDAGALLALEAKAKPAKPSYVVEFVVLTRHLMTRPYDRMPSPEQAIAIVKEGRYASAIPTWGKDKGNVQISTDALK